MKDVPPVKGNCDERQNNNPEAAAGTATLLLRVWPADNAHAAPAALRHNDFFAGAVDRVEAAENPEYDSIL
jgi:hypothetical protein